MRTSAFSVVSLFAKAPKAFFGSYKNRFQFLLFISKRRRVQEIQRRKMKVFILSVFVLMSVSFSSAQVSSAQSRKINTEAIAYINVLKIKATTEKNIFRNEFVSLANQLFAQLTSTKNQLGGRFYTFGDLGKAQRPIWNGDIDDLINFMKIILNPISLDALLKTSLNQLRALVIDPRYVELESVKASVNANLALIACWDNNDPSIKVITDKLIKEIQPLIDARVTKLKSDLITIKSNIKSYGDVFDNNLKGCNSADLCGSKYVN